MKVASVYIHFPWCLEKCPYCDFTSYKVEREDIPQKAYSDRVLLELKERINKRVDEADALFFDPSTHKIRSLFFGGGTPSLWRPEELGRVIKGIRDELNCSEQLEISVECNPTSMTKSHILSLHQVGVNRLSIGAQSLKRDELFFLGRKHSAQDALKTILEVLSSPIKRSSADMIFGLPGQSPSDASAQAAQLAELGCSHLSCYQLTIEAGTRFGELAKLGRLPLASDDLVAKSFLAIDEGLCKLGFTHYEISNYAKEGEEALHNLGYWHGHEYLGLGCGAFGFLRRGPTGVRYRNPLLPAQYMNKEVESYRLAEFLSSETLLKERIMLGLRLSSGLDLFDAAQDLECSPWTVERKRAADKLQRDGRLEVDESEAGALRLKIPKSQWLFTDEISARLF